MRKRIRTISYRPGLQYCDTPFLTLGGKWLAKQYGWQVGGTVEVWELPAGIFIKKVKTAPDKNQLTLDQFWKGGS
jgi:hypothetical protein